MNDPLLDLEARSRLLSTQRDFGPEAEQIHRDLVDLMPLDTSAKNRLASAKNRLAQCLVARGAGAEAASVCESVLAIDPGNSVARGRLDDLRRANAPTAPTPHRSSGRKRTPSTSNKVGGIDRAQESVAASVIQGLHQVEAEG